MKDFIFYSPTKIIFGKDAQKNVGHLAKEFKATKVLIHYGINSVKKSGLLDEIKLSLKEANIEYIELGGVVQNPLLSKVNEGIALCKKENVDFVLALGGGSVIDSSKAIAYGVKYNGNVWDLYEKKAQPKDALSVGCVLTMAAAGSEMSDCTVLTNDEGMLKRGLSSDYGHCKFAICNPELTFSLSPYQTACGITDIIMHTLERYFSIQGDTYLQDNFAFALIKSVIECGQKVLKEPNNYEARAEIMWASTMSHNGVTGDRFLGDWACHQLEHELSGMFFVAHGAGLAAIWSTWASYVMKSDEKRFAKLGRNVFGIEEVCDEKAALKTISSMKNFFEKIGMPTSIRGLGVTPTKDDIETLALKCSFFNTRTIGKFRVLNIDDMRNIYNAAL